MAGPGHARQGGHPVHIHPVPRVYRLFATGLGASMWFFVSEESDWRWIWADICKLFYRAKQDGPALLGLRHPWDH